MGGQRRKKERNGQPYFMDAFSVFRKLGRFNNLSFGSAERQNGKMRALRK